MKQEKELRKNSTISKMEIVQKEGKREVKRNIEFHNLDAIFKIVQNKLHYAIS